MIRRSIGSTILRQGKGLSRNTERYKSTKPEQPATAVLDSATGYFSSLRLRAVNALTASLSAEERNLLLSKLVPNYKDQQNAEEEHVPQHSIAEAVAAARALDAQKESGKWEREKGKLMAEAEKAARARVESDLQIQKRQIAFEQWKRDVELKKEGPKTTEIFEAKSTNEEQVGPHPILGSALVDLGYKRVHLVPAKVLESIPVWKKQRIYRHNRAMSMASDKIKTLHLGLPGVIGIYEVSCFGCSFGKVKSDKVLNCLFISCRAWMAVSPFLMVSIE
jgi:hypothetical protein